MDSEAKGQLYESVLARIDSLIAGQDDIVAVMATVACELHHCFEYFNWTGFYRVVEPGLLRVGPYQGGHGCLEISFDRGVCGAAASTGQTQLVTDVSKRADHIACSSTTQSEIVVPVFGADGQVAGLLDVDSDRLAAFDEVDRKYLERLCESLASVMGRSNPKEVNG